MKCRSGNTGTSEMTPSSAPTGRDSIPETIMVWSLEELIEVRELDRLWRRVKRCLKYADALDMDILIRSTVRF